MILLTDDQAAKAARDTFENHFLEVSQQYCDVKTKLDAIESQKPVAWMVTYEHGGGRQERVLSLTEPPKPRFAALAWVTPLYAQPVAQPAEQAPDCRTCEWLPECSDGFRLNCFEGDQYKAAPKVVLWGME